MGRTHSRPVNPTQSATQFGSSSKSTSRRPLLCHGATHRLIPAPRRDEETRSNRPCYLLTASATGWELLHCSMPSAPSLRHQGCCRQEHAGKPLVQQSSLPLMTSASLQPLADNASTPRELHMRIGALAAVLPCFCADCDATDNHSPTSCAASHLATLLAPRPGRTSTRPTSNRLEHA
jgi:hypothetical protein